MIRPTDLHLRTALSKSELVGADLCQTRAWYARHYHRPTPPKEEITFGSAVDVGVETIVGFLRAGIPVQIETAYAAAAAIVERDDVEIAGGFSAVEQALDAFASFSVLSGLGWEYAATQHHVDVEIDGWGRCDGHPDLILRAPMDAARVFDVKTAKRAKPTARTLELGWYALLLDTEVGRPFVIDAGYLTWVRVGKPYWQMVHEPIDSDWLDWTRARVDAYVRARDLDDRLNEGAPDLVNVTMTAGPKFDALCADCQYADLCPIRVTGGMTDAAA